METTNLFAHRALDKRDRLSLLESSQAAAVGTGDLAGPGVRHVAPALGRTQGSDLRPQRQKILRSANRAT